MIKCNQNKTAVFTIISNNYIAYAKTLLHSIGEHNEDYEIYLVVVDRPINAEGFYGNFSVLWAHEIVGDYFDDMALRYDALELNTAVKPFAFSNIFEQGGYERVVYIDPDILIFGSLDPILKPLNDGFSAVLTPHILTPLNDDKIPNDFHFLQSGIFNLGFAAFAHCKEALSFISWWQQKLRLSCYSDPKRGVFTDQKWCDLAPAFLPNLSICYDPGANVAYWNLPHRPVSRAMGGEWMAAGHLLKFFHFSGFDAGSPQSVSRHQDRMTFDDLGEGQALFELYRSRLLANGWKQSRSTPYGFAERDGLSLSKPVRALYSDAFPQNQPRENLVALNLEKLCRQPAKGYYRFPGLPMNKLCAKILDIHPNLRTRFSVNTPWGRLLYRLWLKKRAVSQYNIPAKLLR